MSVERKSVALKDCWNVSSLMSSFDEWNRKFELMRPKEPKNGLLWPEINSYRGRLHEGPGVLKECLEKMLTLSQELEKLYTYAHLRHDEEITLDENKTAYDKVTSLLHDFQKEMAWFEPEVLALPQTQLETYLNSSELRPFKFHLEKLIRLKPHVLSSEMEELMALSGKALQASHKAFRAISDADFNFGKVEDGSGQLQELTHGSFSVFLRSTDRILRENAFKQMYKTYSQYENTLCELLNGQVQAHLFQAKSRGYASCLEAALFPKNIDTSVYHALIEAVHKKIGALHKYIALRKKLLKVDELHLYDMYVPLVPNLDLKIPYEKAEEFVIESAAPLGKKYQEILSKGLREEGWVDRYENKNKRSGAYSSGCYGSHPFILMNYKDLLRDVFTLAHEAGHSMHSYLSRSSQPYHYADYPIFLAEVASTLNEELLMQHMLKTVQSKEEKAFLINQKIEDIRTTLFRQTMFAEFELKIHELAEKEIPLTPKLLREIFFELNQFYFGSDAVVDKEIAMEWSRIPHFYYNFYVYQYATGISAALALADGVAKSQGGRECEAYLKFLQGGCSGYPLDLLALGGVDMRTPVAVERSIDLFASLVKELENLMV